MRSRVMPGLRAALACITGLCLCSASSLAPTCDAQYNVTVGLRVDGNDLFSAPNASTSAAGCCSLCSAEKRCRAFVYVSGSSDGAAKCWLKTSLRGARRPDKACTAGVDTAPAPPMRCASDEDCNMCGRCDSASGACACDAGWTGDACERVNFGSSYACGTGGLCLHGEQGFTSSWGGEAVRADDGSWHVFAASFANNTALGSWLSLSRVVHGKSASSPVGPYVLQGVALGPDDRSGSGNGNGNGADAGADAPTWDGTTQHNPAAVRAADGTYLLFYMGAQKQSVVAAAGLLPGVNATYRCPLGNGASPGETVCMQRVGLATARSPGGPWDRRPAPIIPAGASGRWDDLFTTNPTPHAFANGSVLLIYKARQRANPGTMSTGVAFADHYAGPYRALSGTPIDLPGDCEDAGIYYSPTMQIFRMLLHCGCNYQTVWSRDGLSWRRTAPQQPWCNVSYAPGSNMTSEVLSRRERPKWVLGTDGQPTHLLNGVLPSKSHGGKTFTMITAINR